MLVDYFYWYVLNSTKNQELQKKILRSNFICFVKTVYKKIFNKTLKGFSVDFDRGLSEYGYLLAKYLEDMYKMQCTTNLNEEFIKYHIINIPPRFGKTETCAIFHAWYLGRNPQSHFLGASYSESLTTESCKKVKLIIKHPIYQAVFPDTTIAKDCDTANFFKTTKQGEYYSTGITGTITGRGAGNKIEGVERPNGFIFLDDPLKAGDAQSPVVRNAVNEAFLSTFLSRKNHPYVPYLIIMQRLHTDDLCGLIENTFINNKKRKLTLPALIKNNPLCEANANALFLKDLQADPQVFWAQYMQMPSLDGDLVFDRNKIKTIYIEPPKELIFNSFTVADTSMVNKPNADFTVFGHFYVYAIPEWRDYWNPETKKFNEPHKIVKLLLREIFVTKIDAMNLTNSFETFLIDRLNNALVPPSIVYIETKSSGIALYQEVQNGLEYNKYNKANFVLQALGKENLPKELRFSQVSSWVSKDVFEIFDENQRNVNSFSTNEYILNHLSRITRVKNSSIKDDIADVVTYALTSTFLRTVDNSKTDLGNFYYDTLNKLTHKILEEQRYKNYYSYYH